LQPVRMSWSGGKDSCSALHEIQKAQVYEVAALLTTVTRDYDRVGMHVVTRVIWRGRRGASLALGLTFLSSLHHDRCNQEYGTKMEAVFPAYRESAIDSVVFGDLILEDIRACRERFLARCNVRGLYSTWLRDTAGIERATGLRPLFTAITLTPLPGAFLFLL
jgi:diphthamide synthase (EF-2-diphthine--ammonia ligase)